MDSVAPGAPGAVSAVVDMVVETVLVPTPGDDAVYLKDTV